MQKTKLRKNYSANFILFKAIMDGTIKSKFFIIITSIFLPLVLILSIIFVVLYKNDSVDLNWVTFPLLAGGVLLTYCSVVNIWFIAGKIISDKKNGVMNTEISSGISRANIVWSRILVSLIISVIPLLVGILLFLIPVLFSNNLAVKTYGINASIGLLVVVVYNFVFIGLGLFCALSKSTVIVGAIGSALLIITGLSPLWSVASQNSGSTISNEHLNQVKLSKKINESKYNLINETLPQQLELVFSRNVTLNDDENWKNQLERDISLNYVNFSSGLSYFNIKNNSWYSVNDDGSVKKNSSDLNNLKVTIYYQILDKAYEITQKIIKENQNDFNNKDQIWENSEFRFFNQNPLIHGKFGINYLIQKLLKEDWNNLTQQNDNAIAMKWLLNEMKDYADAAFGLNSNDFNTMNLILPKDNKGFRYNQENQNFNQWLKADDFKNITPGFRTFSETLTLIASASKKYNNSYFQNIKPIASNSEINGALNKNKLLVYLVPFNTYTSTALSAYTKNDYYFTVKDANSIAIPLENYTIEQTKQEIHKRIYLITIPPSNDHPGGTIQMEFNNDQEAIKFKEENPGVEIKFLEDKMEFKYASSSAMHLQISFNPWLGMFVYWLISLVLIGLAGWFFYRRLII